MLRPKALVACTIEREVISLTARLLAMLVAPGLHELIVELAVSAHDMSRYARGPPLVA